MKFVAGSLADHKLKNPIPAEMLIFVAKCATYLGVFQPVRRNLEGDECTYGPQLAGVIKNGVCVVPITSTTTSQDGQIIRLTAHFPPSY